MLKYYTGIGSKKIPTDIHDLMVRYGRELAKCGYVLRSGAADGADTAFEEGCSDVNGLKEIYLPWKNFNKHPSDLYYISPEAYDVAEEIFGSALKYTRPYVKKYMSRNMYQVTGETLDKPSDFVLCWTPDGCECASERNKKTGGTGQAIAYAGSLGIPVFNLQNDFAEAELLEFLQYGE